MSNNEATRLAKSILDQLSEAAGMFMQTWEWGTLPDATKVALMRGFFMGTAAGAKVTRAHLDNIEAKMLANAVVTASLKLLEPFAHQILVDVIEAAIVKQKPKQN